MAQPPGGPDPDRRTSPGDTPAAEQDRAAGPGQQADTRFARIFALSPVPLALIAEDGRILDVNPALAQLLNRRDLPRQQRVRRPGGRVAAQRGDARGRLAGPGRPAVSMVAKA